MTGEDLGDLEPTRATTTLQSYEIDAVADYVATRIKGAGPVSRAQWSFSAKPEPNAKNIPSNGQHSENKAAVRGSFVSSSRGRSCEEI